VTLQGSSVVSAGNVFRETFAATVTYNAKTPATSVTAVQVLSLSTPPYNYLRQADYVVCFGFLPVFLYVLSVIATIKVEDVS